MKEKYLIINADDFGINEPTNAAIAELMRDRRITSTSLLPCGESARAALGSGIGNIGVHFTLTSDFADNRWRCMHKGGLPNLCGDGYFPSDTSSIRGSFKAEIAQELEAQYRFIANAQAPDHADSHCGTLYLFGGRTYLPTTFALCRKYSLPFRFPKRNSYIKRTGGGLPLLAFHRAMVAYAAIAGVGLIDDLLTNTCNMEEIPSYASLRDSYIEMLRGLDYGVTELFLHPSLPFDGQPSGWQKRVWEYQLLTDEKFAAAIRQSGATLISYGDIRNL